MPTYVSPCARVQLVLAAGLLAAVSAVSAASQCKGLAQESCAASAECTWVDGYTRKDGRTVASHCRLKSGRKGGNEASTGTLKLSRTQ